MTLGLGVGRCDAARVNASSSAVAARPMDRGAVYFRPQTIRSILKHPYGLYFRHLREISLAYVPLVLVSLVYEAITAFMTAEEATWWAVLVSFVQLLIGLL